MRNTPAAERFAGQFLDLLDVLPTATKHIESLVGMPGAEWGPAQDSQLPVLGLQYCMPGRAARERPVLAVTRRYGVTRAGDLLGICSMRDISGRGPLVLWRDEPSNLEEVAFLRPRNTWENDFVRVEPELPAALRIAKSLEYAQAIPRPRPNAGAPALCGPLA
ncbi:MAG TPA: hypothetical protein VLF71_05690 [Candidatus Saccharimonadales bacterium]|nr:hypothetical protein [Candidatus Saccharimonadales bacterium]